ncbi:MAG: cytochrome c-type biosis protein CcmH [Acidobacteriota bacterium]|jgi:cytochrome c-type biogenesis protein CcmH|nr:cytochrome c-type biosis protein CcmH [Acidobacteriota bacterium]
MRRAALLFVIGLILLPVAVSTKEAQPLAEDPVLEARLMALAEKLRCLVCQNETLAASHAPLAIDLRQQMREQMKAGRTDQEIVSFLTDRWGDFVLFSPPVKLTTYLLWFGPFALFAAGIVVQFVYIRRRRARVKDQPLSDAEQKRVESLLSDGASS